MALGYRGKPKQIEFPVQSGPFNKKAAEEVISWIAEDENFNLAAEIETLLDIEKMWSSMSYKVKVLLELSRECLKADSLQTASREYIQKVDKELGETIEKLQN